jgi:hypothetical protein
MQSKNEMIVETSTILENSSFCGKYWNVAHGLRCLARILKLMMLTSSGGLRLGPSGAFFRAYA